MKDDLAAWCGLRGFFWVNTGFPLQYLIGATFFEYPGCSGMVKYGKKTEPEESIMRMESKWKRMSTAMALGAGLLLGTSGLILGQTQPAPSPSPASTPDQREDVRDAQHNWGEFLGQHPELREQLNKNPNLVNDPKFVSEHPELQKYMQDHPKIAAHLKAHPNSVMHHEQHYAEKHNTMQHHPAQRNH